jgi:hypothetical protein
MKRPELACVVVGLVLACGGRGQQTATSESSPEISPADMRDEPEPATGAPAAEPITPAPAPARPSADVAPCVERFPATVPFDAGWPPSVDAMPMQPGVPAPVRTPDAVVAECASQGGTNCDADSFISMQAARCIARATAPQPARAPAVGFGAAWLYFNADTQSVEWSVTAGICCGDTWLFHVDANNGASTLVSHTDPPQYCPADCNGVPIETPDS